MLCSNEQTAALIALYSVGRPFCQTYAESPDSQSSATQLLQQNGLDSVARQQLESRWSIAWTTKWGTGEKKGCRVLVQCTCGYNTEARQKVHEKRTKSNTHDARLWSRSAPYDFTGCLAHADITYHESTGMIRRIVGYLEHNEGCHSAVMTRMPPIPLHQHVVEVALNQLTNGASIRAVQSRNLDMISRSAYKDQSNGPASLVANARYELLPGDFSRIYRLHHKANGIDVSRPAEHNVHNWLDP
ncbi:hypothetical protein EW146_g7525 [Bondarzewia mesenterica]|uniref:Uncharacterized protein n=1 Tax=Bondarzewia mesenterica TaxID=1095465 RepID=A0A4S4LKI2_9AGAM|nr:hypothetical protein EW146_g7525 [Bondarzewia mesenterica]